MLVDPKLVRPLHLFVHKPVGGSPDTDPGPPPEGNTVETKPVVDEGPLSDSQRFRREDLEAELRRGDLLKIARVGKKGKYLFDTKRQLYRRSVGAAQHTPTLL